MALSRTAWVVALLALAGTAARAQEQPDPFGTARLRIGPVALTPTVVLKTLGIDTNVFNEIENPKQDFVTVVGPRVDAWSRLGRTRVTAVAAVDYMYFSHYASERSLNTDAQARIAYPLRWFTPYVAGSFVDSRERQGYEIDARVRRRTNARRIGTDADLGPRTRLGVSWQQSRLDFDGAALFHGTFVSQTLNRTEESLAGSLSYKVTPVTTFVLSGDSGREHFQFMPIRDAESVRMTSGFEFDPLAPLSGKAHVGYRTLDFYDPAIVDFTGPVASVDLTYRLRELTRFGARVERDVGYSFEIQQSYYVINAITASVTQSLLGRWDTQVRLGRQWLDYRGAGAAAAPQGESGVGSRESGVGSRESGVGSRESGVGSQESGVGSRTDSVFTYGVEIGRRTSGGSRLAFHVDHTRRQSPASNRAYTGTHAGASVTYAF